MQPLDPAGVFSNAAVTNALAAVGGGRTLSFRFDRLNKFNTLVGPLTCVTSGSVSNDGLADIKRSAKFAIVDDGSIDYSGDRIKPYARLKVGNGYVEWPLGVYVLSTPERSLDAGLLTRAIDGYDQTLLLQQDLISDRYAVASGTLYTSAIATILGGYTFPASITPSSFTLPAGMEWEPGTSNLQIVNDLLAAINYESVWFDESGRCVARPYLLPSVRTPEYRYAADSLSVIADGVRQTVDLYSIPNKFILIKSEADAPTLTSVYVNTNPASPTSTVSRGRVIATVVTEADAATQAVLDARAAKVAFDASQVYETIEIATLAMPMHSNLDVLAAAIPGLGVNDKYVETAWSMPLDAVGAMSHTLRRVVSV